MKYSVKNKYNSDDEKCRKFRPNDIVRHFKGNLYRIIAFATNTETGTLEVIYESLYGEYEKRNVWSRPYEMFASKVDLQKYPSATQEYRFEIVEIQNVLN